MNKLSVLFGITLVLCSIAAPSFPSSYHFDFDGDEQWDTEWTLLASIDTVQVDIWLENYSPCVPEGQPWSLQFFFQYDHEKIQAIEQPEPDVKPYPNDLDHGGPFHPDWSAFKRHKDGVYFLVVTMSRAVIFSYPLI